MFTNFKKIIFNIFFVFFVVLARTGAILPDLREITTIIKHVKRLILEATCVKCTLPIPHLLIYTVDI